MPHDEVQKTIETQALAIRQSQVPAEVSLLMKAFKKNLSAQFIEVFPEAIKQFLSDRYLRVVRNSTACTPRVEIQYDDPSVHDFLRSKGVSLGPAELEFVASLGIVHGCGRVTTNNNAQILNSFLNAESKRNFQPDVVSFEKRGNNYCEKIVVKFLGFNLGSAYSCYTVSFLPLMESINVDLNPNPIQGFYTWEVLSTPQSGQDPIYFRSSLFLAINTQANETMVHFFTVGRWQDMNGFMMKKAASSLLPSRIEAGFNYLQKKFGEF